MKVSRRFQLPSALPGDSKGIAFLMVLWVITILSIVVLEFCFAMRTEVEITRNDQEEVQLYAAAEGGMQRAIAELMLKHDARFQQIRRMPKEGEALAEYKEWVTDGRDYRIPLGRGECTVRVMGEGGKVNINRTSEAALRKIVSSLGLEGAAIDIVVDSILDWTDKDDFIRTNGAESDYYHSLKAPYDCKNANLDSVEELLLIRGVTPELFYGKKGIPKGEVASIGLKDIFSVYAGEQVDLNSASLPVLRVVLGFPLEACRLLVMARQEKGFENMEELKQRVPDVVPFLGDAGKLIVFGGMNPFYTVEARGKGAGGNSIRSIRAVVKIDPRDKDGYKIIQWLDSFW
jgi:general secretion pathway protein K